MQKTYKPTTIKETLRVEKLYSLHYFAYLKNFTFEGESHDFWELIFCDSGSVQIYDRDEEYRLGPGQAFLHAPNHFHNVHPEKSDTNVIVIGFDGKLSALSDYAGQVLPSGSLAKFFLRTILAESRKVIASPLNIVHQYELDLRRNFSAASLQMLKICPEGLLLTFCIIEREDQGAESRSVTVRQLIDYLKENTDKRLNIQMISYRFGYSPAWLQRIFKAETGKNIMQYFSLLKVERAKRMIADGEYTIGEISDALGYDTPQYFSRKFKSVTNMTPSAYAVSVKGTGVLL